MSNLYKSYKILLLNGPKYKLFVYHVMNKNFPLFDFLHLEKGQSTKLLAVENLRQFLKGYWFTYQKAQTFVYKD